MWVRGNSRSSKLVPFESLGMVSYSPSIVTMAVYLFVYEILIFSIIMRNLGRAKSLDIVSEFLY